MTKRGRPMPARWYQHLAIRCTYGGLVVPSGAWRQSRTFGRHKHSVFPKERSISWREVTCAMGARPSRLGHTHVVASSPPLAEGGRGAYDCASILCDHSSQLITQAGISWPQIVGMKACSRADWLQIVEHFEQNGKAMGAAGRDAY
jgi:hypothetical protein